MRLSRGVLPSHDREVATDVTVAPHRGEPRNFTIGNGDRVLVLVGVDVLVVLAWVSRLPTECSR